MKHVPGPVHVHPFFGERRRVTHCVECSCGWVGEIQLWPLHVEHAG